jgi:hypothetical protein
MIPAHYINEADLTFDGLTPRELAIYNQAFQDGMHRANNDAQPKLGDLELRINKAADLTREAIKALFDPSF